MNRVLWLACVGLVAASPLPAQEPKSQAATGKGDFPKVQPIIAGQSQMPPPAELPADVLKHNADRIRRVLPKGWTLDSEKSQLKIVRDEPVELYNPSRAPDDLDDSELKAKGFVQQSKYVITLDFVPPIAGAELDRMESENAKTWNKMGNLEKKMAPLSDGWCGWRTPRNDEERNLAAEYDKLEASLHHIPEFTTADASIFLSLSESLSERTFTLFYSFDVEKECMQVRQTVEAIFVRQVDASLMDTPEELMTKLADAIDARNEKTMLACFGVNPNNRETNIAYELNAIWVLRTLAALRLRDAMQVRFGCETTKKALTDLWLQAPDTKRLRTTRWTIEGGQARIHTKGDHTSDGNFQINHILMGMMWDERGWRMGLAIPANLGSDALRRWNTSSRQLTEIAEKLLKEVKAGKYKTAEEVGESLRSIQPQIPQNAPPLR